MIIKKAYKFRLKPTKDQKQQLVDIAGSCRFVWNKVLYLNLERLKNKQPILWYHEADFWTKLWKRSTEYSFFTDSTCTLYSTKIKRLSEGL